MILENPLIAAVLFGLPAYLCGSLPFAVWITRLVKGVDVRDAGSGHATTTNTIRQAGFGAGALVLLLDIAKGFLPTWLAVHYAPAASRIWIVPLTAALAVVGHCWPLFAGFRGGMGLACAGGCLLAANLLAFLICAAILIALTLTIHHGARASVFTGLLAAPLLWLLGLRDVVFWMAVAIGIVIAFRFLIDWNRQYRELWLDREKTKNDSSH
ncbi:MAG TPA: glycerol-3-phosphate acyltransferase [Anaerolineales bacterium]|nr:glycerol-3-phosphate acyltransferase [Anaerolineales bacterium]